MSFNSSTSSDPSLSPLFLCFTSTAGAFILSCFVITYVLFLPLFVLVICLALHQRRRLRCRSTTHSDFFTYNVVGLDIVRVLGFCVFLSGVYSKDQTVNFTGIIVCSVATPGQILFHLLTCVERYLAVVHPVTYLGLKQAGGLRLRNVSAGCVWLLCGLIGVTVSFTVHLAQLFCSCLLVLSLILVSFCSFSVLRVLTHSGPGQVGRTQVDQSKQRAFHTIAAIMVAQYLSFLANLVSTVMFGSSVLTLVHCAVGTSLVWLTLPCSLVLPLLFLHRAGKLAGCKRITKAGRDP